MSRQAFVVLVLLIAGLFLAEASMYRVGEHEQVLRTEFGKIVGKAISTPGLHWKAPFVQDVRRMDKRWLQWDGEPNQIPTRDKKYIWVDTFARWRIKDPIKFYERLRDEQSARSRLDDIIDGEVRNVIANHDLIDIVRTSGREFDRGEEIDDGQTDWTMFRPSVGRMKIEAAVLAKASTVMPDYGVELADVRIKRINYVESVQQKVFERMVSERKRIAERYRSEGQGKRAEIEGKVERELLRIRSEAYKKAEEIRGKADAEAARTYAEAYNRDPDLYAFMKTLETYKSVMAENTDLVLSTKSPLLKYLRSQD
jgi:modulator of FtsH protease HflC